MVDGHQSEKTWVLAYRGDHTKFELSNWEWLNSVVRRNRDGIFPLEWRSHERGKGNFSMNHERHIIFSPRMA